MSIKVKNNKKTGSEKEFSKKMGLFDKLPDYCLTCLAPFNKKDKQMVMTWYVIVREKEKKVNLYCPSCWDRANQFLEEVNDDRTNS